MCCALWLAFGVSATAEAPGTAAITVLPAGGQTRGVQIRAQTVDAVIREEGGAVWAETRIWINFYNAGKTPVVVPVTLPGPQPAPAPLPEGLRATLDNKALLLTPLPQRDGEPQIQLTAPVTVPMKGTAALRINYRQALPVQDGLAAFSYWLAATADWSGRPESLRVTVRFDPPLASAQMLDFTPALSRRERDGLTWHWENTKATENIGIAFIAPSWWADLEAARQQAASKPGLKEYTVLAERYWRLANLTPPAFRSEGYFERFFPPAVEALTAGIASSGAATAPADVAEAHSRLAGFYRAHAQRLAPEAATPYLQLAASELQAALALNPTDAPARQAAAELHRQLLQLARDRGDALAVQEHQARLSAIGTEASLPSGEALAHAAALALAEQAVERGDLAAARQLVSDAFGSDAVTCPEGSPPRIAQTRVSVTTSPTTKTFSVEAIGGSDAGAALLRQASASLAEITGAAAGKGRLDFSLPYADAQQLLATQANAAAALADLPELALLAAALMPTGQEWRMEPQPFSISERYVEMVDLRPAPAVWETRAERLAAAAAAARMVEGAGPEARLARVQAALWAEDAAAWRALAERSRAVYRVEMDAQELTREWEMAAGETREISARAMRWRYDRLGGVAGGAALLLTLMVYLIWRASGRT